MWLDAVIAVAILAGFGAYLWRAYRPTRAGMWAWVARLPALARDWWGDVVSPLLHRLAVLLGLAKAPAAPAPAPPPPASSPPAAPPPPPLDPPAVPVSFAAPAGIPPDHATVHARIAGTEFETDAELLSFYAHEAAAAAAGAQAWQAHAERLVNEIGLDPNFTQVAALLADEVGDMAQAFAMVGARLNQVYAAVQQAVADGLTLPYDARGFLTGEGF